MLREAFDGYLGRVIRGPGGLKKTYKSGVGIEARVCRTRGIVTTPHG